MRYLKAIIPGIGLTVVLILAAVRVPAEILTYAILIESCIFIIADPYKIIHFWLSTPARWILMTIVVVDTVVFRIHQSVEFVAIPVALSLVGLFAILRYNTDWRAQRAYREDEIIQKAMSLNEESSAYKSWMYHGRQQCIEMAYRIGVYTGRKPFNQVDVQTWQAEQSRIENREPISNIKQCISVERMIDFMRMCYSAGYLRSVSYKAELLETTEELEAAQETIQEQKKEIEDLMLDKKEAKVIIDDLEEALTQERAESDSLRDSWGNDTSKELEYKKERDNAVLNWQSAVEYSGELEKRVDNLEIENRNLQFRIKQLEKPQVIQKAQVIGEQTDNQQDKKQMRRMKPEDIKRIKELREMSYTISEIAERTGFSQSSVKRALNKEAG